MKKPVIAIDGYSSTGKSSISKALARKLGLIHVDTGALYRGITLYGLHNHLNTAGNIDLWALEKMMPLIHLEFRYIEGALELFLNGNNVEKQIRDPHISKFVSIVAKQPFVRQFLLGLQQKMAEDGGIIMDGRDIGTVVLPNADLKFFLTASIEERTRRRYAELLESGIVMDRESVMENLLQRDKIDSEREVAPLKQAADAIPIDNTKLNKDETIKLMLSYINRSI